MLLKDLCTLDVSCCPPGTGIQEVARLMRSVHVGDVIVVNDMEDRKPLGIVTDRDIVVEMLAEGRDPHKVTAGDFTTRKLVIASQDESADTALARMQQHGVRRLPIVDAKGGVVGVVTLDDLLLRHASQAAMLADVIKTEQTRERRTRR